jgi:predicted PilT family ATPase
VIKKAKAKKAGSASRLVKPRRESTMTILMRLLLTPVPSTANGKRLAVPPLEAIVTQLVRKALEGNARAVRALERYKQLASQSTAGGVTVEFVDSETADSAIGKKDV